MEESTGIVTMYGNMGDLSVINHQEMVMRMDLNGFDGIYPLGMMFMIYISHMLHGTGIFTCKTG